MDSASSDLLPALLTLAGLVAAGGFAALVARRARQARRRQIDAADEPRPAKKLKKGSAAALLEEEEEEQPELEAELPHEAEPEAEAEPPTAPARAGAKLAARPEPEPQPEPAAPASTGAAQQPTKRDDAQILPFPKPGPGTPSPAAGLAAAPAATPAAPVEKPTPSRPFARPRKKEAKDKDVAALKSGLGRTRAGWISRLGQIFAGKKEIDPSLVDEIEKVLLTADIGVKTSQKLLEEIRSSLSKKELADADAVWSFLRQRCREILTVGSPPLDVEQDRPFVLLVIGVNGSGKTTTIGKLASKLKADGLSVLLAAGDTFRAAATEQLEVWGKRVGAEVVRGKDAADPSSVIFEAVKRAKTEDIDVVVADTAGRLHTKTDLMQELQKVRRVMSKAHEGAPHETWLVIDATSGQNAINQAQIFTQAMAVTGIVLTKLDGTAKGGVILGIAEQLKIPVRFIGVGERVDDLREFDPEEFVEALFDRDSGGDPAVN